MMWHTFNQPLAIQFVTVCLCGGGVLERFPNLRVALLEGNCSWAPWLLHRLDEHYEWTGWYEATDLTMKPSDYFRRSCFLVASRPTRRPPCTTSTGSATTTSSSPPTTPTATREYPHAVDGFEKLDLAVRRQGPHRRRELVPPLQDPPGEAGAGPLRTARHVSSIEYVCPSDTY